MKQGDSGLKCAKITAHDRKQLRWSITSAIWCGKPATRATVLRPGEPLSWVNVGHFYCDAHASQDAVAIPA